LITNLHAKQLAAADYKLIGVAAPPFALSLFLFLRTHFPDRQSRKLKTAKACLCERVLVDATTKETLFAAGSGHEMKSFCAQGAQMKFSLSRPHPHRAPLFVPERAAPTFCLLNKQILVKSLQTHSLSKIY
jgi:hypothetical protein